MRLRTIGERFFAIAVSLQLVDVEGRVQRLELLRKCERVGVGVDDGGDGEGSDEARTEFVAEATQRQTIDGQEHAISNSEGVGAAVAICVGDLALLGAEQLVAGELQCLLHAGGTVEGSRVLRGDRGEGDVDGQAGLRSVEQLQRRALRR